MTVGEASAIRVKPFYQLGGNLPADAPSYVRRSADVDLLKQLSAGRFCYVLTSRQMGKSSLMVQTAMRLRQAGTKVAVLDLTRIGQNLSPEQWYDGLLIPLAREFNLEDEIDEFWNNNDKASKMGPMQRWIAALQEVILRSVKGRIVLFVDEIDAVRGLPFSTDEFFAGIRQLYNERTIDPDLERLTFCLLGVAKPSDLIRNVNTTPFNVGHRIELTDFTEIETEPLLAGLCRDSKIARQLLHRVLWWTGGHPYLTQRMCARIAQDASVTSDSDVDQICIDTFLSSRAREKDDNLLFVRERVLRSELDRASLLDLYEQIHSGKNIPDDDTNALVDTLRLSGIVAVSRNRLVVRNLIYAHVFDRQWIRLNMPAAELRRQKAAYRRGIALTLGIIVPVLAFIVALCFYARSQAVADVRDNFLASTSSAQEAFNVGDYDTGNAIIRKWNPNRAEGASGWRQKVKGWWDGRSALENSFAMLLLRGEASGESASILHRQIMLSQSESSDHGHTSCDSEMTVATTLFKGLPLIAAAGVDSSIQIWSLNPEKVFAHLQLTYQNGRLQHELSRGALTPCKDLLGSASGLPGIMSLSFSPDGSQLAIATGTWRKARSPGSVLIWDLNNNRVIDLHAEFVKTADSVQFSEDGEYLAASSEDATADVWRFSQGSVIAHTHVDPRLIKLPNGRSANVGGSGAHEVALSPKSEDLMALGYGDGHLVIYSLSNLAPEKPLYVGLANVSGVMSLLFLQQKNKPLRLAVGSRDGELLLVDPRELINADDPSQGEAYRAAVRDAVKATLRTNQGVLQGLTAGYNDNHSNSWLLTSGSNGTVGLWSVSPNLHLISTFRGHTAGVNSAAFCTTTTDPKYDSGCVVSGGSDNDVRIWKYPFRGGPGDAHLAEHRLIFQAQMVGVAFPKSESQTLITAVGATTEDNRNHSEVIATWNYKADAEPRERSEKTGSPILGFDVSPDGKFLISTSRDRDLVLMNLLKGADAAPVHLHVHVTLNPKIRVRCLNAEAKTLSDCLTDQRDYLVMGVADRADIADDQYKSGKGLCLWHIRDYGLLARQRYSLVEDISNPCQASSPLVEPSTGKTRIWPDEVQPFFGLARAVGMFDISTDGKKIVTSLDANDRTIVKIWDTHELLRRGLPSISTKDDAKHDTGFSAQFANMCFSPDGLYLAATTIDAKLYFWRVDRTASVPTPPASTPIENVEKLTARGQVLAFDPNAPILAIGLQDSNILLWSTRYGRDIMTIRHHTGGVLGLAFSPDGQSLASSGNDGQVTVLEAAPARQ
jgi:WD40 repeat protein